MGRKKRAGRDGVDTASLLSELWSDDEAVRARAVRSLCPCHAGWEVFERHVGEVARLERDASRSVRAEAAHVFYDAAKMLEEGEAGYRVQFAEWMTRRKKRASRFRPGEAAHESKRRRGNGRRGRSGVVLR